MPIHFLLCNTCYWCPSDIGSKSKFTKCPSCNSVEVESMSIAKNEFDCYPKRGITQEFSDAVKFQ
jgi:3'-phosphoadenosine 5'-phosphosulfate (PAPS) 3'-phosphatase